MATASMLVVPTLPARVAVRAAARRATRVQAKRVATTMSVKRNAVMAAAAATPLMYAGNAMAANIVATVAAAEATPEELQAFSVLLGGSAVIITAVLSLVIGSDLFIKDRIK